MTPTFRRLLLLPFLALLCLLPGCNERTVNLAALANEPITVSTYTGKKGRTGYTPERRFTRKSPEHRVLMDWAALNTEGWEPNIATYVPGTVIRGKTYTLNILTTIVVLDLHGGGSFTHDLLPKETELLKATFAAQ